jgi:hypothetical protein
VPRGASFESGGGDEKKRKKYVFLDVEEPITYSTMDKGSREREREACSSDSHTDYEHVKGMESTERSGRESARLLPHRR